MLIGEGTVHRDPGATKAFKKPVPQHVQWNKPLEVREAGKKEKGSPVNPDNSLKNEQKQRLKTEGIAKNSEDILLRIKSVWPFDFFPDELIVDKNKVSHIARSFWTIETVRSFMLTNISEVIVNTTPFFSSLTMVDRSLKENVMEVKFLHTHDAIRARRIVQGLVLLKVDAGVDLSKLSNQEIIEKAEMAGKARS